MQKLTIFIIAILFIYHPSAAQDDANIAEKLKTLDFSETLPEGILQTKSIAIIKIPPKGKAPRIRGDWKAVAKQAQPGFKKAGVDVVAYYYIEDIYSGKESLRSFLEQFKAREIKNIVFVIRENGTNRIVLLNMPEGDQLIVPGHKAWQIQHSDLSVALDDLYKIAANSSQERQNRLILEVPEFGRMAKPINGRRGEYYDLNFSSYKLAIPVFADTSKIRQVMAHYPYEYGFVIPDLDEKEIRSKGYQYILYFIHSTGKSVKEMLDYPTTDSETAYVSEVVKNGQAEVKSYNIHTPVYKFYIKHIYSGNVFLGKKWDAAPTWQEALTNYIDNLRTELIRD